MPNRKAFLDRIMPGIKPGSRKHRLWVKQKGCCYYCRKQLRCYGFAENHPDYLTVDHKIPVSCGGRRSGNNLCLACYACNQDKNNLTKDEYQIVLWGREINASGIDLSDMF